MLEIACLGNPERTLQGELLAYLRSLQWPAVQEMGCHNGRNLDIVVFEKNAMPTRILCVIELKHYSANQGSSITLTRGMDADVQSALPDVPLMQVGLYTVVTQLALRPSPFACGNYRFVDTYCTTGAATPTGFHQTMVAWSQRYNWVLPVVIAQTVPEHFFDAHGRIDGLIEFFVGIHA